MESFQGENFLAKIFLKSAQAYELDYEFDSSEKTSKSKNLQ